MRLWNRVFKDSLFSFINTVILALAGVAVTAIAARHLDPGEMGAYSFVIWLFSSLGLVFSLGLPGAINRFGAEAQSAHGSQVADRLFRRVLLYGMVLGLIGSVLLLGVGQLAWVGSRLPVFNTYSSFIVTGYLVMVLQNIATSYAKSQRQFQWLALVHVATYAVIILLSLLLGANAGHVESFLRAYLIGMALLLVAMLLRFRFAFVATLPRQQDDNVRLLNRRLQRYSLTLALIAIVEVIVWQRSEVFILEWFGKTEEVAFYNLAYDLSAKSMRLIPGSVSAVLLPVFAGLYGQSQHEQIVRGYQEATRYLALLALPLAAALAALAGPLVRLIYGPAYASVTPVLQMLVIGSALAAVASAGAAALQALERQRIVLYFSTILAVLNVAVGLLLAPRFGAQGAAAANSATQFMGFLIGIIYLLTATQLRFPISSFVHIMISALAMAALMGLIVSSFDSIAGWLIAGAAGSLLFLTLLWFLDRKRNDFWLLKKTARQWQQQLLHHWQPQEG